MLSEGGSWGSESGPSARPADQSWEEQEEGKITAVRLWEEEQLPFTQAHPQPRVGHPDTDHRDRYVATVFVAMYAPLEGYDLHVPKLQHYYGLNHLHYLSNSTFRRTRLYDSERFRNQWVLTLEDLRREWGFKISGDNGSHFYRKVYLDS
jgi:hypothetical protein